MNFFWFRRDLRLHDNTALHAALSAGQVQPIFIFDSNILQELDRDDPRVTFIHTCLEELNTQLKPMGASIKTYHGDPMDVWDQIISTRQIEKVYFNRDYEPYAIARDTEIRKLLAEHHIGCESFKDQVIFESNEVLKADGTPYTIYTPYKNKWLNQFESVERVNSESLYSNFVSSTDVITPLKSLGFVRSEKQVKPFSFSGLRTYHLMRDFPAEDQTSYLSPHLRFGTISVRECVDQATHLNETFLSELIWREFFMQILVHYPHVTARCFKSKYDSIQWRDDEEDFQAWCRGETGYPFVDAGMRQLNTTGYMHNRVRMITASFLVKHLLVDWRWGERYFARHLLDFDLSSNNGNWQWAAGTGCDAAPYFRIFNPIEQLKKFDPVLKYSKTWIKDFNELTYPKPIVDHKFARERCLATYKSAIG